VVDLCREHGVVLKYLPAYSPDFNPIETSFHLLKAWMKKWNRLAPVYGEEDYTDQMEAFLEAAVNQFGRGVDFKALFRKCFIKVD